MNAGTIVLDGGMPGTTHAIRMWRFGTPGAAPKVYVQAGLHADEVPGMLVARHLIRLLQAHDAAGRVVGEVVVVPMANPIGLAQRVLGGGIGRFALADGVNFNRDYPGLADAAAQLVAGQLSDDPADNVSVIRAALLQANAATTPATPAGHLKKALLGLALDADLVLDLHCENEGVVHLYTSTPLADRCAALSALLGAEAVLLAAQSGGDPFDEACSRPWLDLQARFDSPIPLACCAVTVELRGEADVGHALASADADALLGAMILLGAIDAPAPVVPPARCQATLLADVEVLAAPISGILVLHYAPGDRIVAGDLVAEVIDPASGAVAPLKARHRGLLFAQEAARFVAAGRSVAKIAGNEAGRTGPLLGA